MATSVTFVFHYNNLMQQLRFLRKQEPITGSLHNHLVMLDLQKGKYFSLNPVAARIWALLEKPHSIDELCNSLIEEYDVDADQCRQEVEEYLSEMKNLDLILQV